MCQRLSTEFQRLFTSRWLSRRKFVEAKTVQVKGKTGKADWAINHIQKLYRIETEIKDKTAADKHRLRQEKSAPLLKQFKDWLDKLKTAT